LVENVIWGEGLAENVTIPSYRRGGLKLLKNRHMIFQRSLKLTKYCWLFSQLANCWEFLDEVLFETTATA